MQNIRFLHAADLHLGTPFRSANRQMPDIWMDRVQQASYEVFRRIVDTAIEQRVDFVILAGDLMDSQTVPMAVYFEFLRGFRRLEQFGILVFLCHGNHDPLTRAPVIRWPDNVTVFPAIRLQGTTEKPGTSVLIHIRDCTVQVAGFSYRQSETLGSKVNLFVRDPRADIAIGLYHGAIGPTSDHAPYCATALSELNAAEFDYWALGHIHQSGVLHAAHPAVVYPGNPQGRHIRETGRKGCFTVEMTPGGAPTLAFHPIAELEWVDVEVSLDGTLAMAELREAVLDAITAAADRCVAPYRLFRVRATGSTSLHARLDNSAEVLGWLREEIAQLTDAWLIVDFQSDTSPALDIETLRNSPSFLGECLRLLDELSQDSDKRRVFAKERLAALGKTRLSGLASGWLSAGSDTLVMSMLEQARRHILTFAREEDNA